MKRKKYEITLLAEGDLVNYYSFTCDDDEKSAYEYFCEEFDREEFQNDMDTIYKSLELIAESGAEDRHFRYAGKRTDNAMELPPHLAGTALRLYCLRLSAQVVIVGNGGKKITRTYQEDPRLMNCVKELQALDDFLRMRREKGTVRLIGKDLTGHLTFYI